MAESKAKKFKSHDVVLKVQTKKGKQQVTYDVTPASFHTVNFEGAKVSGEDYYVDKAVKLGASK